MLDASTRVGVLNLLAELKSRGLSILFITHDLSLGYYISQKSVILYRGCVVEMGPTEQVYHHPLHPYTKMLMAFFPRLAMPWVSGALVLPNPYVLQPVLPCFCAYYYRCPVACNKSFCCSSPS